MAVCRDHRGRVHLNVNDMCEAWGIKRGTYDARRRAGWSLAAALETPAGAEFHCADHLGREYPSVRAMCQAWGVSVSAFNSRMRAGEDVAGALTRRVPRRGKPCADHLGREYPSFAEMCRAWRQEPARIRGRIKRGWSLEDALETPGRNASSSLGTGPVCDHLGREYPDVRGVGDRQDDILRADQVRLGHGDRPDRPQILHDRALPRPSGRRVRKRRGDVPALER